MALERQPGRAQWKFYMLIFTLSWATVCGQEKRCICSMKDDTELSTYDLEKMRLPLPCHYSLTSIKTRNGRCLVTVDLAMTSGVGTKTRPAGLRYLVTQDGRVTGGVIDENGVTPIDPEQGRGEPFVLPELSSLGGVEMLAYMDQSQSYKLALTECLVTLYYKPGHYLGVFSHDYSYNYRYNPWDLCGDCDGSRNEMKMKLPPDMAGHVRSLQDRDAAMLYMASAHIKGGSKKCYEYRQLVSSCDKKVLLDALKVCGQLFDPQNPLVTCLKARTYMGQILDTYFKCVRTFCYGNSRQGCRYIYDMSSSVGCKISLPTGCQ